MDKNPQRLLVIDDDPDILLAAELLLQRHFADVVCSTDPMQALATFREQSFDAVLLDMNFSPGESNGEQGIYWLKQILAEDPEAVVIMITAHGGTELAVRAMKHGATDFICKPWENDKVIATLTAATKLHASRARARQLQAGNEALMNAQPQAKTPMLGESPAMQQALNIIERAGPTEANVLILGENGTGKELAAREIHRQSHRADEIFVSIDLGAIADSLFESELFGHKKGAFTGATKDRDGLLVSASGGTLFLDEIGNLPLHLQAKLLTVLEQRRVTPVGSEQSRDIDVRIIAATNLEPAKLHDGNQFRQDLLYRLNTVELTLPPLRERGEDILALLDYYLEFFCRKYRTPEKQLSDAARQAALSYPWPGNVRALRHTLERAIILSTGDIIEPEDMQLRAAEQETSERQNETPDAHESQPGAANGRAAGPPAEQDLNLENHEKNLIHLALTQHGFNISQAAKALGITRAALYRRMEKHGL